MTFPARDSQGGRKGGLPGAIAQVRPRSPLHTTGLTWGRGYRRKRADRWTGRASLSVPRIASLTACPPVGGHFPLLPATLCRRSPAPGMGAAAAVGFRSFVAPR